jgi:uncharacterized membrane protein YdjX (TVP38/TMEM64 family)
MWRDVIRFCRYFFAPKRLEEFVASRGAYAGVVFVALQALQVIVAPIPGEVTGFVGGFLFGNVLGTILSTLGLTLGSLAAFGVARWFGMRLVEKVVKKQYRDRFDHFATHKGLYIVFVLFLIPGFPKDSLCYLLGLTHMKIVTFTLMNIFGRLPGTLLLTMQGTAVSNEKYKAFFILLGVSLVMVVGLSLARNHLLKAYGVLVHRLGILFKKL